MLAGAKYGALSQPNGQVSVKWTSEAVGTTEARLVVDWGESGGREVTPPARSSYGSSLIRELVPYQVSGSSVELDFPPSGVACRIVIPLERIVPDSADADG